MMIRECTHNNKQGSHSLCLCLCRSLLKGMTVFIILVADEERQEHEEDVTTRPEDRDEPLIQNRVQIIFGPKFADKSAQQPE
jgi:hypothetical protein